ncbi:MAG: hypothetical protein WD065_06525 [Planctomycetaceae bacterium]
MPPEFYVAKLLRDHGVSDNGILQLQYKQIVSNANDRESIRNLLIWVAGFVQSHQLPPIKVPNRER